ncbi:DUF4124 domain-containing protein [Halomonas salina]|uniref:DUF4124 domain-containing protein n=1 Tax=Halomonas salina TaxID=42565 RepID=A0ABR4WU81_9GAMM|nr:DUF4124 domain-containing protein [Halomonas salina]KGE78276.1 hypothetical protein FP66_04590 [Halomonas salina]
MHRVGITTATGAVLALLVTPAAAQVHKCVQPDGSTTYTSAPCETGQAEDIGSISITPGFSPEQRAAMDDLRRQQNQRESDQRQQRIDATGDEVRRIQRQNADPQRCQQARDALQRIGRQDRYMQNQDEFEVRQQIQLYCNP